MSFAWEQGAVLHNCLSNKKPRTLKVTSANTVMKEVSIRWWAITGQRLMSTPWGTESLIVNIQSRPQSAVSLRVCQTAFVTMPQRMRHSFRGKVAKRLFISKAFLLAIPVVAAPAKTLPKWLRATQENGGGGLLRQFLRMLRLLHAEYFS